MISRPFTVILTPGDSILAHGGYAQSSESPHEQVGIQFRDSANPAYDVEGKSIFVQLDLVMSRSQAQEVIEQLKEVLK